MRPSAALQSRLPVRRQLRAPSRVALWHALRAVPLALALALALAFSTTFVVAVNDAVVVGALPPSAAARTLAVVPVAAAAEEATTRQRVESGSTAECATSSILSSEHDAVHRPLRLSAHGDGAPTQSASGRVLPRLLSWWRGESGTAAAAAAVRADRVTGDAHDNGSVAAAKRALVPHVMHAPMRMLERERAVSKPPQWCPRGAEHVADITESQLDALLGRPLPTTTVRAAGTAASPRPQTSSAATAAAPSSFSCSSSATPPARSDSSALPILVRFYARHCPFSAESEHVFNAVAAHAFPHLCAVSVDVGKYTGVLPRYGLHSVPVMALAWPKTLGDGDGVGGGGSSSIGSMLDTRRLAILVHKYRGARRTALFRAWVTHRTNRAPSSKTTSRHSTPTRTAAATDRDSTTPGHAADIKRDGAHADGDHRAGDSTRTLDLGTVARTWWRRRLWRRPSRAPSSTSTISSSTAACNADHSDDDGGGGGGGGGGSGDIGDSSDNVDNAIAALAAAHPIVIEQHPHERMYLLIASVCWFISAVYLGAAAMTLRKRR